MNRSPRAFLDTSVIFAAVLSESGVARLLFKLGEVGILHLIVGSNVLRECEEVVRRKAPGSLPVLAYLLELAGVEISKRSPDAFIGQAEAIIVYKPDAIILAKAMAAETDCFITHDKAHFLDANLGTAVSFRIGTPGDLIQALEDDFTQFGD